MGNYIFCASTMSNEGYKKKTIAPIYMPSKSIPVAPGLPSVPIGMRISDMSGRPIREPVRHNIKKWECDATLKKLLETYGLFDMMRDAIEDAVNAQKVYELNIARNKLDAINRAFAILKSINTLEKNNNENKDNTLPAEITVSLKR